MGVIESRRQLSSRINFIYHYSLKNVIYFWRIQVLLWASFCWISDGDWVSKLGLITLLSCFIACMVALVNFTTYLFKQNLVYNGILNHQLIPSEVQLNLKFRFDFKQWLLLSLLKTQSSQGNKTIPASCSFETCIPDKILAMKTLHIMHICDQIVISQLTYISEHKGHPRSTYTNNLNKSLL